MIVQAACLAHDIGNPPFGHAGEAAIREWFRKNRNSEPLKGLSDKEMSDFENFDGNAQGHRILSKLEYHFLDGGMRLTYATLGTMMKYPRTAFYGSPTSLFMTEAQLYRETAWVLGLPEIDDGVWQRHPLVYLMEAADDICYSILDVEDAIELASPLVHNFSPFASPTNAEVISHILSTAKGKLFSFIAFIHCSNKL